MLKLFTILSLIFTFQVLAAEEDFECGARILSEVQVFELSVELSFDGTLVFKLCEMDNSHSLLTTLYAPNSEPTNERIDLSNSEAQAIIEEYEEALRFNALDDASGLDGSYWCIETQRGLTTIEACFFSPGYNSEERGLSGLYNLGDYLWQFTGLQQMGLRLY